MKRPDFKILLSVILCCTVQLSLFAGGGAFAQEPRSQGEVTDVLDSGTPRGWINSVSTASIIIDDTHYVLFSGTRFPDGRDALMEGEFVRFQILEKNILAEIALAKPLEEDMYMKPITRNGGDGSTGGEAAKNSGTGTNQTSPKNKGMRLENGVWVN